MSGEREPQAAPQADGLNALVDAWNALAAKYEQHAARGLAAAPHDRVTAQTIRGCARDLADRLAARDRDHEAEVARRLAEQREGIAAALDVERHNIESELGWYDGCRAGLAQSARIARTYGAES